MNEDRASLWAPNRGGGRTDDLIPERTSNQVKFAPLRLLQAARTLLETQVREKERDAAAILVEAMRHGGDKARFADALDRWCEIDELRATLKEVKAEIRKRETTGPVVREKAIGL
jgi:hypothetical protein